MINSIRQLVLYRELLYMIVWRDIRVKYKQSLMGILWAILMPMIIVSAGILVKYGLALASQKPFNLSDIGAISVKAVPWAFFIASLRFSTNSLIGNTNLVTKIYFPRVILPIASVCSQVFDLLIASSLLTVMLASIGIGYSVYLLFVPILMALLVLLATGIGIFAAAANLFYRDVKYLVEVILTFAIFFTPIFYDVSMFGKWGKFLLLNPVAPILEGLSSCVVRHEPPPMGWILYAAVTSILIFLAAFSFFQRAEPSFAERI